LFDKMAQFDAKKFADMQPKKETSQTKKEKPVKEPAKPQEQKEKKKAVPAEEEMDECEAALASEPRSKDPFAHQPKS
ncbi:hypothetical protein NHX12_029844, partial [Muraenolepis orangiensis]